MIKPELLKKIKHYFNLNIYETKVWLALLAKGVATAGQIAELSGVPRSRTYDVLESLEKQGFAIPKLGKPIKYIAVKPSIVLERLKNKIKKETDQKLKNLTNIKDTQEYKEIELLHKTGIKPIQPEELSGSIKGRSLIHDYLREMLENASKEVILATTSEALKRKFSFLKIIIPKLKRNNVKIKIAASGNPEDLKKIARELKVMIKKTNIKSRFYIVDNSEVLFMLTPEHSSDQDIGIWINSKFFAQALATLFNINYGS